MKLNPRLEMIAKLVDFGAKIIDVGCDHAYISAYLLQNGICETADASDINPGPLKRAEATLQKHGLIDRVKLFLSSGLDRVPENVYDTVILAGMGGETISEIIDGCRWIKSSGVRLILNPMTADEHLRRYLYENGFCVIGERLALEGTKLYVCIKAKYDGSKREYKRRELVFTDKMDRNDPLFSKYINERISSIAKKQNGLRKKCDGAEEELSQCEADIKMLHEALKGG